MNTLRFLIFGVREAEHRLAQLTAGSVRDDAPLWRVLRESIAGRVADGTARLAACAAPNSRAVRSSEAILGWWRRFPASMQLRFIGLATLAAVSAHIPLSWPSRPVGYWWLIVPAIIGAFGLIALALSFAERRAREASL